jgi:hypothetical protein
MQRRHAGVALAVDKKGARAGGLGESDGKEADLDPVEPGIDQDFRNHGRIWFKHEDLHGRLQQFGSDGVKTKVSANVPEHRAATEMGPQRFKHLGLVVALAQDDAVDVGGGVEREKAAVGRAQQQPA